VPGALIGVMSILRIVQHAMNVLIHIVLIVI
jgi:hypothetical protein